MTTAATPPTEPPGRRIAFEAFQRTRDERHLKTLSVFYYAFAGLTIVFGCAGVLYLGFGVGLLFNTDDLFAGDPNAPPPEVMRIIGGFLAAIGVMAALYQFVTAVLLVLTARFIAKRRNRMFCLVVAGLSCLSVPLGTALGVYTFVILTRPEFIERFGGRKQPAIGL